MANRFPLIVDVDDGNKIKELPEGDNLDLINAGIVNLQSLSLVGALNAGSISSSTTLSVTGNASVGGTFAVVGTSNFTGSVTVDNIDATTATLGGSTLQLPVQSNWLETNSASLAFIQNKPTSFAPDSLDDIGDVFVADAEVGEVLTYDGFSWNAQPAAGGVTLADFSVIQNPASGSGSLVYNNGTGVFTFTPAVIPTNLSELTNDTNFTTLTEVDAQNYMIPSDVLNSGRITRSATAGQVTLGFDDTGIYTTITTGAGLTGVGTIASPLDLASTISVNVINAVDGTTASTFKDTTHDNITVGLSLSSTNGNFTTTNGNITATNGAVTGNNIIATNEVQTSTIINAGNTITLNGSKVQIQNNHFGLGFSATVPASPSIGDIAHTGDGVQTYVSDIDGAGTPGWIGLGGTINQTRGSQLPVFVGGARPASPRIGEMIWDDDVPNLKIWDGAAWLNIGP